MATGSGKSFTALSPIYRLIRHARARRVLFLVEEPPIGEVQVTDEEIIAHLVDGRPISVPLPWSWRLSDATPEQQANAPGITCGQSPSGAYRR